MQAEGGFGGRLHAVFEEWRVSVKEKSNQWWSKEEKREEREHPQPEAVVKHL